MADPSIITVNTTWTLVAADVSFGMIAVVDLSKIYKYTYRDAGGTAPTDDTDARVLKSRVLELRHVPSGDFYMRVASGTATGTVRLAK